MKKIFAADFGAGNTCLYFADPNASIREASPLNDPAGEPSGYAVTKRGDVLLGLGLSSLTYEQLQNIDSFHINIKAKPNLNNREEMVQYFKAWREYVELTRIEEFKNVDEPYWFIGCPTGDEWKSKETRELYKSIFEEAGYRNVFIVPESNAAFAYYEKNNQMKKNNKSKYLLFDQGAYSLDVTYYSDDKVVSHGGYLGASLIERMMIHTILESDEENIRMGKRMINLPETLKGARDLFKAEGTRGLFYTYLLLKARRLKERYFTDLKKGQISKNIDLKDELDFTVDGDALVLFTNHVMMENILETNSIRNVLGNEFFELAPEVQENIGNKTWMQAFRGFLLEVDKKFPDIADYDDLVIMLTGGGSLMPCIYDAVKEHYNNATIHYDREAISAIGRGMAFWAPDKIRAQNFEDAFEKFINREEIDNDGDKRNCVDKYLANAYVDCVVPSAQEIVGEEYEAIAFAVKEWVEYNCNSQAIPARIESHFKNWCKDTGVPGFNSRIKEKVSELKSSLNRDFNLILDEFSIPAEDILKDDDEVFLSDTTRIIPKVFDNIVDIIVGHYQGHKIWDVFNNRNRGIFSDHRSEWWSANVDAFKEWVEKETDSTFDLCKEAFFKHEFDFSGDKVMLGNFFIWEGNYDLVNLMRTHVKVILGQLVLEEYIDE